MAIVAKWTKTDCAALRDAFRWKHTDFAAALGVDERTVRRWQTGERPIGHLGQTGLGSLLARAPEDVVARFEQLRGDDEVKRRSLFRGVGAGAAALATLGLGDAAERVDWLMRGAGRPDMQAVKVLRRSLHLAQELDDTLGSPAAQGMAIAQTQVTEAMLRDCPAPLLPRLQGLYAEWVAFGGCLAWDAGDPATAGRLYYQARENAHEAEDDELSAFILCHLSQLATWSKRPRIAVDHATAARGWAAQTQDGRLRAYAAMRAAEAAAIAGQDRACLHLLDEAETALDGASPAEPGDSRAYFVGTPLLESYRGGCLSILGDNEAAVVASRRAADLLDPVEFTRDRAVTLLELGRAHAALNDIEAAAAAIGEAAELSTRNRSPRLAGAIEAERHHLAPWVGSRAIRDLDIQLSESDIVVK